MHGKARHGAIRHSAKFFVRAFALLSLIYIFNPLAQAVTITATGSQYEAAGIRYFFTVEDWNSSSSGQSWCQNPNTIVTTCSLSIRGLRSPGNSHNVLSSSYSWDHMPTTATTMGELYGQMNSRGFWTPFKGSVLVPKDINPPLANPICIGFTRAFTSANTGGFISPIGPCSAVIAPPLKCDINGDSTLNHGKLTEDRVDGHVATTQLTVACTGISKIKVSLVDVGSDGIRLRSDGSLYSKIRINNRVMDDSGELFPIDNMLTLDVSSRLSTRGDVDPGPFSGSAVLRVTSP
ncbi:hypothetical protein [Achromobacter pestifer]|uniref:Fimbrial adhesin MrpH C-terminal domain-containing protein n=1 Tax=Achromobacter pestifer TaxID=1353889 RepID=A0A6S6YVG9_9BURK|nr:hypothetical protein [Achromobacter pestifer]CAB3648467.1 hypothetical protein LMG3431_02662 [Achromobacter pestifer]